MRDLLRRATAQAHDDLDRRFGAMIAEGAGGYATFLAETSRVICPLERALTDAGADRLLPDWRDRLRANALRADLTAMGAEPGEHDGLLEVGGEAHQFGMIYVLEGSRLGARVLLREIEASADSRVGAASRFLRHGEGRNFWRSFLERLEASAASARAPHRAVAGAHAAFALFGASSEGGTAAP